MHNHRQTDSRMLAAGAPCEHYLRALLAPTEAGTPVEVSG